MTTILLETMFCRSPQLMTSGVGEEIMMMDINKGMYYALNPVSSRIWTLLEQPLSVQDLCKRLLVEYDIEPDLCEQEVKQFLEQLLARKVVTVVRHKTDAPSKS